MTSGSPGSGNLYAETCELVVQVAQGVEPERLDAAAAEALLEAFTVMHRATGAVMTVLAARVAECGAARRDGARSDDEWVGRKTGQSPSAAKRAVRTARNFKKARATEQAQREGRISAEQADAIAGAAAAHPEEEERLLGLSQTLSLSKLQDECNRVRSRGEDAQARHDRIHRGRYWRRWTDHDGAACGSYRLTPEAAAVIESAARPYVDGAFDAARAEGRREASEAYAADGLVAMARAASAAGAGGAGGSAGDGGSPAPRRRSSTQTILLVNVESLRRGHVEGSELCEIGGVGPVPVATALELLGPDGLKLAVRHGEAVSTVVHLGRSPTAAQRTALYVRDRGRCVRPTCGRPAVEIDHTADWAATQQTLLDDLGSLCAHDHDLKTHRGHTYRRGAGGWEWARPDGTVESERPPPAAA